MPNVDTRSRVGRIIPKGVSLITFRCFVSNGGGKMNIRLIQWGGEIPKRNIIQCQKTTPTHIRASVRKKG